MAAIVYVPQVPRKRIEGVLRPQFDFSAALPYGELRVLIDQDESIAVAAPTLNRIKHALRNYTEQDYIIAVGDPSLIAAVVLVAMKKAGRVNLLKWDRMTQTYHEITFNHERL